MSKNVLIIGANRGIGLELCRQYIAQGNKVIATCRRASSELSELDCQVIENVEVTCSESLKNMLNCVNAQVLDIVIHNSGILRSDSYPEIDIDNMKVHFDVNTLGPLRTVTALEPLLKKGSKVGIVSSRVGSIDDNTSSNNYAYRVSKTAVNMVGKCLSIDLAPKGIALALLHPGYVKTDMTNHSGLISAQESASGLIQRMDELGISTTGIFVHTSGEVLTW
jgi:NAD(P)-dependent dehydrogenase (short-subunit alcohol dehydrogenase family)